MTKIRADLEGVVFAYGADGSALPTPLRAGDDVPEGITVGSHLTDGDETDADGAGAGGGEPPRAGRGSGKEAWAEYATGLGVEFDPEASRDDIIAAVDASRS